MTEDNFKWTDELVMEIIGLTHRAGYHKEPAKVYDRVIQFKQSKLQSQDKPQPSSIDRIEVSTLVGKEKYADPRCTDFIYSFESNSIISPSNFHAIKQAIEQVLNESDTIDIDWSSKPVTEKYYKQSEVDTIRKESFDAGRNHNGTPKYGFVVWEYPTLQDYLNSLSKETKPKEEDKPVIIEDNDRCGICGGEMVYIRGRYPNTDKRKVCPTCTTERLEQISDLCSPEYGKAYQNKN